MVPWGRVTGWCPGQCYKMLPWGSATGCCPGAVLQDVARWKPLLLPSSFSSHAFSVCFRFYLFPLDCFCDPCIPVCCVVILAFDKESTWVERQANYYLKNKKQNSKFGAPPRCPTQILNLVTSTIMCDLGYLFWDSFYC